MASSRYPKHVKRALDLVLAVPALVAVAPLLAGIALAIRCESPGGPIIYRGRRAGIRGVPFDILKFRSMVVDAERVGGGTTAHNDPRITRVGAVLRRYKLDELPQLINVIRGEMSLVGPRPELLQYTDNYNDDERCILDVLPGITDLSSIEFASLQDWVGSEDADKAFEERVLPRKNALRAKYAREQSLLLDLEILARTALKLSQRLFQGERR